jgi:hypothetical protein
MQVRPLDLLVGAPLLGLSQKLQGRGAFARKRIRAKLDRTSRCLICDPLNGFVSRLVIGKRFGLNLTPYASQSFP